MRFGLRERFVAVLALVSALTLAVEAVALFSPLNQRLRSAARVSLTSTVRSEVGDFTGLPESAFTVGNPRLLRATRALRHTGAEVAIFDSRGRLLVTTDPDPKERYLAAAVVARTGRAADLVSGEGAEAEAQSAIPAKADEVHFVVAARRHMDDLEAATSVVQRAFYLAAGAGLLVALAVGILIAGRTAGRIRRLRDTAERVAQVGPVAEFSPEAGRDEIGDLSRTFAFMQERLREQEHARRAFVATASHELRTPVASMQIMLDLLIADLETEPLEIDDALEQARRADQQAARLSQLASELLDLSRIDAGVPVRREEVDLSEILRSVLAELDVRLVEQGRTVSVADDGEHWALADPGHVAGIIRILLDNALRHTDPPAGISVELVRSDERAGISVTDAGPGVPADERERIFERFARGAQISVGGFGLGLAIARELARRMNGDVALEPTASGACFVLWLERTTPP